MRSNKTRLDRTELAAVYSDLNKVNSQLVRPLRNACHAGLTLTLGSGGVLTPTEPRGQSACSPGTAGHKDLSLIRAIGRTRDGVGAVQRGCIISVPQALLASWPSFHGFEPGRHSPRFGDVVRRLSRRRERRRTVPLATGVKIGPPVDLSGFPPPLTSLSANDDGP